MINRLSFVKVFNYWLRKIQEICNSSFKRNKKWCSQTQFMQFVSHSLYCSVNIENVQSEVKLKAVHYVKGKCEFQVHEAALFIFILEKFWGRWQRTICSQPVCIAAAEEISWLPPAGLNVNIMRVQSYFIKDSRCIALHTLNHWESSDAGVILC